MSAWKKSRTMSALDYLTAMADLQNNKLTREEFKRIRNNGTEEELREAIERMNAAGGYDNLE